MTIGLIYTSFGMREYLDRSLAPWIALRKIDGHRIIIVAVSVRFSGFETQDDGTRALLRKMLELGEIDHLIDSPNDIPETQARGAALTWLKEQDVEATVMWDGDESSNVESLSRMLSYVESNPWVCWYRIAYRNIVFNEQTWLADPFTPPRVHIIRPNGLEAMGFSQDNDIYYKRIKDGFIIDQGQLSSATIPETIINPLHFSWLNNLRSKEKIRYQLESRGWPQCSFSWDDSKGGLIFNPSLPKPRVVTLSSNSTPKS